MPETQDLFASLLSTWQHLMQMLPGLGLALALLVVGWVVARMARRIVIRTFRFARLDVLAERMGIEGFLMRGGVQLTAITLAGEAVYWLILFLTSAAVLDMLAVPADRGLVDRLIQLVPRVVVIIIILLFGTALARVVGSATNTYLNNVGSKAADAIAALARAAIMVFVVAMALEPLSFRSEILVSGFQIVFGALCLALALAFGLGGRDWAARVLDRLFK